MSIIQVIALVSLVLLIVWLDLRPRCPRRGVGLVFMLPGGFMPVTSITVKSGSSKTIAVRGLDDKRQPVALDEVTSSESLDPSVVEVDEAEGQPFQFVITGFAPGTALVSITADVALGERRETITKTLEVHVLPNEAVDLEFEEVVTAPLDSGN
jgi:hypothetical protein